MDEGIYNITYDYEIVSAASKETVGYVDVSIDKGERVLKSSQIAKDEQTTITLENVSFDKALNVEFRVYAYDGCKIKLNYVQIERVS